MRTYILLRKFKNAESKLYYIDGRYYSPETRQFLSPLPTETIFSNALTVFGLNPYHITLDNTVNRVYNGYTAQAVINGTVSLSRRNLSSVPEWIDTLSTAIDHSFSIINPIRTVIAIGKYENLWNLMRLDGVTELPGTLSKVVTGVGLGLGIIGGSIAGYEKYASGASLSSSIAGGIINAGINIGGMYMATGLASLGMGVLTAAGVPGGIVVIAGAVGAIVIGVAINHLFTKLEIGGNTIEGYLNDFFDWLIFWD